MQVLVALDKRNISTGRQITHNNTFLRNSLVGKVHFVLGHILGTYITLRVYTYFTYYRYSIPSQPD